jgi:glycosyltransferase involved in cell wall biosynthesis/peptidoglycan/xylan/chitin deacetylase (PgdA/CDA1 family)
MVSPLPDPPAAGGSPRMIDKAVRFSIVIPTHQRRNVVARNVAALGRQTFRDFEVVVVDDGSTDGAADALRALRTTFPLKVLKQPNHGAAHARNTGAANATGEILLFLDDDMEAEPSLLLEHDRSHREGAVLVLGDVPLHPESPKSALSRRVGSWARSRRDRLVASRNEIELGDLLTGQMSIARSAFERLGGFDVGLTRGGLFGGEDIDFGYRVVKAGHRVLFNAAAISYQYYDVDPADLLRRAFDAGRAEVELAVKHPERALDLANDPHFHARLSRWLLGPLVYAPSAVSRPVRVAVASLARRDVGGDRTTEAFFAVRTMERLRGARAARRTLSTGHAVVLAFHAIADLSGAPILREYGVSPSRFAEHLDSLVRAGYTIVDLDILLRALDGEARLPRRAVLLTFDDGYADLLRDGRAVLAERGMPGVVFAVAGHVGGTNDWDREAGAPILDLLDATGLRALADGGIEVGSHGATHRSLVRVPRNELDREVEGSAAQLEALGLPRPRVMSYPHGAWNAEVVETVWRAGYAAAFTVDPGVVTRATARYALPRLEVMAGDTPLRLRLKIATARWPRRLRTRLLRLLQTMKDPTP